MTKKVFENSFERFLFKCLKDGLDVDEFCDFDYQKIVDDVYNTFISIGAESDDIKKIVIDYLTENGKTNAKDVELHVLHNGYDKRVVRAVMSKFKNIYWKYSKIDTMKFALELVKD